MTRALPATLAIGLLGFALPAHAAGDAAAGKAKAASCAMCHGPTGGGTSMAPKLAGEDPAKFTQAMLDYKSGKKRQRDDEEPGGASLSNDDIANLAAYYASLK